MVEDSIIVDLYLARDESAIIHAAEKCRIRRRHIADHILHDPSTAEKYEKDTCKEVWNLIPPHEPWTISICLSGQNHQAPGH